MDWSKTANPESRKESERQAVAGASVFPEGLPLMTYRQHHPRDEVLMYLLWQIIENQIIGPVSISTSVTEIVVLTIGLTGLRTPQMVVQCNSRHVCEAFLEGISQGEEGLL